MLPVDPWQPRPQARVPARSWPVLTAASRGAVRRDSAAAQQTKAHPMITPVPAAALRATSRASTLAWARTSTMVSINDSHSCRSSPVARHMYEEQGLLRSERRPNGYRPGQRRHCRVHQDLYHAGLSSEVIRDILPCARQEQPPGDCSPLLDRIRQVLRPGRSAQGSTCDTRLVPVDPLGTSRTAYPSNPKSQPGKRLLDHQTNPAASRCRVPQ
jgi:hypothetical protein